MPTAPYRMPTGDPLRPTGYVTVDPACADCDCADPTCPPWAVADCDCACHT